jgi:hypothetical protein
MNDQKVSVEDKFRESLRDAGTVIHKLSNICVTFDEALGMIHLALENDGQLRLLMASILPQGKK